MTVYRLITRGERPAARIGRSRWLRREDRDRCLTARRSTVG
ncbi:MAG TPA: hypothetical protein VKG43_02290 [Acidimicrobiales bacterium]|nr:hypothetical protein [Acidimicrobiales bacterium]